MSGNDHKLAALQRALARERLARHSAEQLLESKSSELYDVNQHLMEAREVLEQKVAERTVALRGARDNAVRLMEERTIFLARISHELRTPLNSILGIVQLMLQDESRGAQRRKLDTVYASSNVLLTMINEILDFTKIEAGEASIESVPTNVADVIDLAVDMLAQTASAKGVALYVQKRAGFPEHVATDRSRLTQIVLNLLSNAVKFTTNGSVTINLDMLGDPVSELVLSISDTGVGVHPDKLENIFEPFRQSVEGKQVHSGGTGLGLSIAQRSAQLLGGDVTVKSTLGEGSTFTVRLPISTVSPDATVATEQRPKVAAAPESDDVEPIMVSASDPVEELSLYRHLGLTKALRILVADDNQMNRSVIEMQLDYLGYQADYVSNGEEVVRALLAHRYNLVLLDISMPLMNGEEACQAIRKLPDIAQPIIVAVTASAMSGDRERYLAGGMDHYLPKPVDSLALAKLITSIADAGATEEAEVAGSIDTAINTIAEVEVLIDLKEMQVRLGAMLEPMLLRVSPIFIGELPARLERLRRAWAVGSHDETASILHALKGSAASAGASAMAAMCGELETRMRSGDSMSNAELEQLVDCSTTTAKELQNIVDRLQG